MFEVVMTMVFEGVVLPALSGTFRRARTPMASNAKWAAWLALLVGVLCLTTAAIYANELAAIAGLACVVLFVVLGIWAAAINARDKHGGGQSGEGA